MTIMVLLSTYTRMFKDTSVSPALSELFEILVPLESRSRMLGTILVMQSQGILSGACRDGSSQLDGEQGHDNETNEHVDC